MIGLNKPIKMNYLFTLALIFVFFIGLTNGAAVHCTGFARALELNEENVLDNDPCGGRVCQEKCSCGKTVYFNLEGIISQGGAAAYQGVCVTEKTSVAPPDENFVFNELKSSLAACGYKEYANVRNFVSLSENVEKKSYNVGFRGTRGSRKAYPPRALLKFALALKILLKFVEMLKIGEENSA
jgi:hypothetical protein